jgi:lipopolysaccharide export system protein LptC
MWERWVRGGLLGLTVVLACFLVYLLATRVESVPSSTLSPPAGSSSRSDAEIDRFRFTQSRAGAVQWEVKAARARVFDAEHRAVLDRVRVTLYGKQGWELKLEGDEGTIDIARKDFVLVNRVEPITIQFQGGYTMTTNHLAWTDEAREIHTLDPVAISGQGLEVKGRGFVGKLDTEEFRVLENVQVAIAQ